MTIHVPALFRVGDTWIDKKYLSYLLPPGLDAALFEEVYKSVEIVMVYVGLCQVMHCFVFLLWSLLAAKMPPSVVVDLGNFSIERIGSRTFNANDSQSAGFPNPANQYRR
ncbi:hypothetical protein [uncultured Bifidobacterium sp.]|uniref:hypothetical protein n=1 Tax=uncultured Bifidobacterium sp. TaxID=165187 RepID=UPI0026065F47|nr:hypothetical protein [uncultured Bifidobacterium sp.]